MQPKRLLVVAHRLLAGATQVGHDLGHDEYHGRVDRERDPVLRGPHRERSIWRKKEVVVGKEPEHRSHSPGAEPAHGHADHGRHHEHQGGDGHAQVRAEWQEQSDDCGERHHHQRDPECRALVRSPGVQLDSNDVCHSFRSAGDGRQTSVSTRRQIRANGKVEMSTTDVDEGVRPAGRFRVYLGAAAGVGKTCAMLDEGWRRFQRGSDVVVGFVETHERPHTMEQIRDLPVLPRLKVEYRNAQWEEMDVDSVLERAPEVVLIDELAHTNVPGSGRHEKRWEDVLEILEAGIAVITTVNVQHIESLADAVERITGVGVRERVPDWVVRKADQIELIDSSADQLRRRMLHGNIYPAHKVHSALNGFFRAENLVALRELALRFVADETEEELLEYLRTKGAAGELWETTERIMVAVTGAPGNAGVVRRAARIAARVKAPLIAVHVVSSDAELARGGIGRVGGARR